MASKLIKEKGRVNESLVAKIEKEIAARKLVKSHIAKQLGKSKQTFYELLKNGGSEENLLSVLKVIGVPLIKRVITYHFEDEIVTVEIPPQPKNTKTVK